MRQGSNRSRSNREFGEDKISNSKALGVIALIALLFLFQVVTFVLQKFKGEQGEQVVEHPAARVEKSPPQRFNFNPNTIPPDSLVLLGFTPRQAQSVVNYREKGGTFRVKSDFARLYVVDSAMYHSLEEFIVIPQSPRERKSAAREMGRKSAAREVAKRPRTGGERSVKVAKVRPYTPSGGGGRDSSIYICNLNTADSAALVRLYGIGPYFARKILGYRELLGGSFADPLQLLEIDGFTRERFDKISRNIVVHKGEIKKFSLLEADKEFLQRHPYIGPYAARGILVYIGMRGEQITRNNLQLLEELQKEGIISEENGGRLKDYLINL